MFAIKNIKTGKWLYGSDFRYSPPRPRTSYGKAITYELFCEALLDFKRRRCSSKWYRIVPVDLREKGENNEGQIDQTI